MAHVYFVLGIHNHQPTGNFDHVFEWAYTHSYKPFLDIIKNHSHVKISIHHSGPLLDWLRDFHPEYLEDYRNLAEDGRVEIIGGAYYEPILPIIPDEDKIGQLYLMKERLRALFSYDPVGVWVPERVWEPYLPKFIAQTGYRYVVLDDVHFLYAGLKEDDLTWFYITEDSGFSILAFPDLQKLRYMIPFHTVDEIEGYFREFASHKEDVILVMADDGEKFGVWPGTYKHVYEDGWLNSFFEMLGRLTSEGWFTMTTFEELINRFRPRGRIYMPTASYIEMTEWVLPPAMAREFENVMSNSNIDKVYLRGGHWRMFFSKYYESNLMKSRMLEASRVVASCHDIDKKKEAQSYLYRGQTNCAYWHGVFGGLYLPHLRRAIYENLIKAEDVVLNSKGRREVKEEDFDSDGEREIIVRSPEFFAVLDRRYGAIMELDFYPVYQNLINVMKRYEEAYHEKVYEAISPNEVDGTKTIHEVVLAKENNLIDYLIYDKWNYMAFLDFGGKYGPDEFFKAQVSEPIIYEHVIVDIDKILFKRDLEYKELRITRNGVEVWYEGSGKKTVIIPLTVYDPSITVVINKLRHPLSTIVHEKTSHVCIDIPFLKIKHEIVTDGEIVGIYPIYTVSNSESGFEKVFQGSVIVVHIQKGLIKWGVKEI